MNRPGDPQGRALGRAEAGSPFAPKTDRRIPRLKDRFPHVARPISG